jgi:hypothetical protein
MRILARCFGIGVLIIGAGSAGMAQSGGTTGGVVGGVIGGIGGTVGGAGGTVGGVVGGVGSTVGGVGGGIGGLGGPLGGLGGPFNGVSSTINGVGSGISSGGQMVGGRFVDGVSSVAEDVTRQDIERELESNLNSLLWSNWVHAVPPATLLDLRKLRLQQLVAESAGRLEFDGAGNPAVRGRLVVVAPSRSDLAKARKAGFGVIATERDPLLNASIVVLGIPAGMTTPAAMVTIRRAAPQLAVEFDHVFEPAGGALAASSVALAASSTAVSARDRAVIGMIDGGVAESPALQSATIDQKGFAGPPQATGHGTAIASLIVGSDGKFRGAAPGTALLVGDVYGGNPAAGSALAIVKAMSWIAANRPSVINVSLVGPRNRVVERAVAAAQARGIKVVAAVGNDGPAAPPLYPASQAGVIAVSGVDATNRALAEAGKPTHLDYSAPGADMAAALPGKGYANVRGTSFAAPFVSARLALAGSTVRLDAEASKKGFGRIGRGIVCGTCRVAPKKVGAK